MNLLSMSDPTNELMGCWCILFAVHIVRQHPLLAVTHAIDKENYFSGVGYEKSRQVEEEN